MPSPSRSIVVTGASGGIGAALAIALARRGHRLVLAARRPEELEDIARRAGGGAAAVVTDVTVRAEVLRLRAEAERRLGAIDVWISNAGRGIARPVLELTDEDIDEMILVNTKSALYGMQAVVPHFQQRGHGHLINISSFLARVPIAPVRSAYSAAKAALNALTASLRMDLAVTHPAIHVSVVMPAVVLTEFGKNARGGFAPPTPHTGPMRPQSAEEVAEAIADLVDRPRPELFTNPASPEVARRYFEDVGAFEARLRER